MNTPHFINGQRTTERRRRESQCKASQPHLLVNVHNKTALTLRGQEFNDDVIIDYPHHDRTFSFPLLPVAKYHTGAVIVLWEWQRWWATH